MLQYSPVLIGWFTKFSAIALLEYARRVFGKSSVDIPLGLGWNALEIGFSVFSLSDTLVCYQCYKLKTCEQFNKR